jgi:HTH-type transcriptional regulator / antitoxin HigA
MMDVRPIRTDEDLAWAIREIEQYFDELPEPGSPEADRFDVLTALINAYENDHHPIPETDPIDMLHFAIESMGRSQKELSELLGSRSRASEVLARKRPLTVEMVHKISKAWHLPAEALVQPYELRKTG